MNRRGDSVYAIPLLWYERGEPVGDHQLVVLLTLLGAAVPGEELVGQDEPLWL